MLVDTNPSGVSNELETIFRNMLATYCECRKRIDNCNDNMNQLLYGQFALPKSKTREARNDLKRQIQINQGTISLLFDLSPSFSKMVLVLSQQDAGFYL